MTKMLVLAAIFLILPGCVQFTGVNLSNASDTARRVQVTISDSEKTWLNETVDVPPWGRHHFPIRLPNGVYYVQAVSGPLRNADNVQVGGGTAHILVRVHDTSIDIGQTS